MKILIVEGNDHLANFLSRGLTEAGYILDRTENGCDAIDMARNNAYDAVVMDRVLHGRIDGLGLISELRQRGDKSPILVMGSCSDFEDWTLCLDRGADDYLVKPFSLSTLLERLHSVIRYRRSGTAIEIGELYIDLRSRRVVVNGKPVLLNQREFQLLEYLIRHADQIVTRTMLLSHLWQPDSAPQSNVVDVQVCNLRRKLDGPSTKRILKTVRREGYIFLTKF